MILTKELFSAFTVPPEPVDVPELGATVYVRVMSGEERFAWLNIVTEHEDDGAGNQAALLVRCLCDDKGKRIFGDDDAKLVAGRPSTILDKLGRAAMSVNLIGSGAEKNSGSARNSDSSSSLPGTSDAPSAS